MSEVGDRYCPSCGQRARASSAACPHCSYNFARQAPPQSPPRTSVLKTVGRFFRDAMIEKPGKPVILPPAGDKTCPQCAEAVKAEARVCRFCGWNFLTSRSPKPPAPKNSFQSCMGCVGTVILILIALSVLGGAFEGSNSSSDLPTVGSNT